MNRKQKTLAMSAVGIAAVGALLLFTRKSAGAVVPIDPITGETPVPSTPLPTIPEPLPEHPAEPTPAPGSSAPPSAIGRDPLPLQARAIVSTAAQGSHEWFKGAKGIWMPLGKGPYGTYRSIGMLARNQNVVAIQNSAGVTLWAAGTWYPQAVSAFGLPANYPLYLLD